MVRLNEFRGTAGYHRGWLNVNLTDGVFYVASNGASWLISDICSIVKVEKKVSQEEFVAIKCKFFDKKAKVTYTDGNENVLYTQEYEYTDWSSHFEEQQVVFYYVDNVLLLSSEY